jgi:hypothetical protein
MSNTSKERVARAFTPTQTWEGKRRKALQQLLNALESSNESPEALNTVLDALTLSHLATRFELDNGPSTDWQDREARALERVASILQNWGYIDEDPETVKALNPALDEFAIAHAAVAFEGLGGSIESKR